MKTILTTASVIALMAGPAFAQDTTMPERTNPPAAQEDAQETMAPEQATAYTGELSVDDLMNKSVKNSNNESIGDVNDVRLDTSGKVAAVIVGVGGFLGLGEKDVAMPFDQLSFSRDSDGDLMIIANVTKESLQAAPEWKKPDDRS